VVHAIVVHVLLVDLAAFGFQQFDEIREVSVAESASLGHDF